RMRLRHTGRRPSRPASLAPQGDGHESLFIIVGIRGARAAPRHLQGWPGVHFLAAAAAGGGPARGGGGGAACRAGITGFAAIVGAGFGGGGGAWWTTGGGGV